MSTLAASVAVHIVERRSRWTNVAIVAAVTFLGAIVPLPERWLSSPLGLDKLLHVVMHVKFTAALASALEGSFRSQSVIAALAVGTSIGFGVAVEHLQNAVPGRTFERGDVEAAILGSLLGVHVWRTSTTRNETR